MSTTDDRLAETVLGAATLTTGLMAGLFYAFDVSVMPGLSRTDDKTFVTAMRSINNAIENPLFAATYTGALALPVTAGILHWRAGNRRAAAWAAAGVLGYGAALVLTSRVNIPLNKQLAAAGAQSELRAEFERVWRAGNSGRTAACTVAFACLLKALTLRGRS